MSAWPAGPASGHRQSARAPPAGRDRRRSAPGVDLVSLNVTVTDGRPLRHRPDAGRVQRVRGRRQAGRDLLHPHEPADRAVAAARHERQHGGPKLPTAQEAAIGFAKRLRPQDLAEVVDFDSRVTVLQTFTSDRGRARAGDPQDVGRRLDVAVQRRLHRAEGPEEDRRQERPRRSAARRSSCCRTARTRRACCPSTRCSTWPSGPRRRSTRSACGRTERTRPTKGFKEAEFVLRQLAQETGGRAVLPEPALGPRRRLRPDLRRAVEPVHGRLHVEEPEARRRLAPHRRPREPAERDRADQTGLLRADASHRYVEP